MKNKFSSYFLKPLIKNWKIQNPKFLWIANTPVGETGFKSPQLISVREIEKILKITWSEVILKNIFKYNQLNSNLVNHVDAPELSYQEYLVQLEQFQKNCIIRWLNNEIGWVLALRPGKALNKGFVCCYTGIAKMILLHKNSNYLSREYFFSLGKSNKYEIVIDARETGNLARFLPFLLEPEHLENFQIDPGVKDKIALANLQFRIVRINGFSIPCIYSMADIKAPDHQELLLGLNYSLPYLFKMTSQNHQIFKFIHKDTFHPIDSNLYQQKMIQVNLQGLSFSFQISRLRIMLARNLPELKHRTVGFDEKQKKYYEIIIPDIDMYNALLASPESNNITVKPIILSS